MFASRRFLEERIAYSALPRTGYETFGLRSKRLAHWSTKISQLGVKSRAFRHWVWVERKRRKPRSNCTDRGTVEFAALFTRQRSAFPFFPLRNLAIIMSLNRCSALRYASRNTKRSKKLPRCYSLFPLNYFANIRQPVRLKWYYNNNTVYLPHKRGWQKSSCI